MKTLQQLYNASKRKSLGSITELFPLNNSLQTPLTAEELLTNYKPNDYYVKPRLGPSFITPCDSRKEEPVVVETTKFPLNFAFNFNPVNNYPSPSDSAVKYGDNKPKTKKRSVGINTNIVKVEESKEKRPVNYIP